MIKRLLATGLITALFAPTLYAAPDILPGLWENKIDISSKSGAIEKAMEQAKQMLENMPPEQQKMMKDMMAKQGVNFDFGTRTLQNCVTQADIDKFNLAQTEDGCTQTYEEKSKNHFVLTMKCPAQNMSGSGEFHIQDNKHYSGTIVMDMAMNGQPDTMTMKQEGQWLSADCGDMKSE